MKYSAWTFVESQDDLNTLRDAFDWDEAELIEFYGCLTNEPYFPEDISRSGQENMNVHLLVQLSWHQVTDPDFVELVLIDCDLLDLTYMQRPRFTGRVDSLKRVYINTGGSVTEMRCGRLIYRVIYDRDRQEVRPHQATYFKQSDSVK